MRIICLTKKMAHHGRFAGYPGLLEALEPARVVNVGAEGAARWASAASRRIVGGRLFGSAWWGAPAAMGELGALFDALRHRHEQNVIHVLYGEDLLGLLPEAIGTLSSAARVVATFHQPPERLEALRLQPRSLRRLAAAITLDDASASSLRARQPGLRVEALRLGIDTRFWTPPESTAERARSLLIVGAHQRDARVLDAVVRAVAREGILVRGVGVARHLAEAWSTLPHVTLLRGIDDEELRGEYWRAGCVLLALERASANNALLQAMATASPLVVSNLDAVTSYIDGAAAALAAPGDAAAHLAAVRDLLAEPVRAKALGVLAARRATACDWRAVAEAHRALYQSLFD